MNNKLLIFSLIIIFIFGYILYEAKKIESKFDNSSSGTGTVIKKLPNLSFTYFSEPQRELKLHELSKSGKHVFIHFWATWCAPCEKEFPELVEMLHLMKDKKNIVFLLVAVNDEVKKIKKFIKQFDLKLDNVVILEDKIDQHKELGTYKMPESFLFFKDNTVVKKFTGQQQWTNPELLNYFKLP